MLVWDATCPDTFAPSQNPAAVRGAGVVVAQAEQVKVSKHAHLDTSHHFVPFVVETSRVLGKAAEEFTWELARHIYEVTGEPCSRHLILCTETFNRSPNRKCSSSLWSHGKETGLLQVTCMLIGLFHLLFDSDIH